jgi:hypothetical protein
MKMRKYFPPPRSTAGIFCSVNATILGTSFLSAQKSLANISAPSRGIAVAKQRAVVNAVPVAT